MPLSNNFLLLIVRLCSLVVRISAEVTKPRDDRPSDGIFTIALELTAMGSPAWESARYAIALTPTALFKRTNCLFAARLTSNLTFPGCLIG